jgi:hypothetical protein
MSLDWSSLTFTPSDDVVAQVAQSWGWLIAEPFTPVMFSALGDMFYQPKSGGVWWLNTGTGEITQVGATSEQFHTLLKTDYVHIWFMPDLVEQLRASGKTIQPGQCYTYVRLPVFADGTYDVSNIKPARALDHFASTGEIIRGIQDFVRDEDELLSVEN